MRINHIVVDSEFRKAREIQNQNGETSYSLTFEDSDCNTFDVSIRDQKQFYLVQEFQKAHNYRLDLTFFSGTSRNGNHYEMLAPAFADFATALD